MVCSWKTLERVKVAWVLIELAAYVVANGDRVLLFCRVARLCQVFSRFTAQIRLFKGENHRFFRKYGKERNFQWTTIPPNYESGDGLWHRLTVLTHMFGMGKSMVS